MSSLLVVVFVLLCCSVTVTVLAVVDWTVAHLLWAALLAYLACCAVACGVAISTPLQSVDALFDL